MERVKPGCFIDKQDRSMMKSFFFKVSFISYVLFCADFGKNTQKIWHVQFLHKMENLCMERVKPGRFNDK